MESLKNKINLPNAIDQKRKNSDVLRSAPKIGINPSLAPLTLIENLIDRNRLAEVLGISPSTISKMMAENGLPYYKIGKACRFKVSEVMAFLERRGKS